MGDVAKYICLCPCLVMISDQEETGDWCVLSQLGWIDEMGNENNETSTADLMSLKPEVGGAWRN